MTRLRFASILLLLSFSKLVYTSGNDDTPTASPTSTASTNGGGSTSLTGDSQCPGSKLMCITATVNGSTVTYELQSQSSQMAWMAVGFGGQMADTPMVIMWPNSDNTISLSQRQAPAEVMPTPVPSPPRLATVATPLSTLNGPQSKLTFTIDASNTQSSHIYAFGTTKPNADPNSSLQQHLESGVLSLDLSKPISGDSPTTTTPSGPVSVPFLPYQKTIIAHASVASFAFLFLLPLGALVARYTRTYSSRWFQAHFILQGVLGGIFVIVGCTLGIVAKQQHHSQSQSQHKTLGLVLLGLVVAQIALGIFIHYVKVSFRYGRPPQNYAHAILGLGIIALALYQVRLGYNQEWPDATGRGPVPKAINTVWMVWVVLLPVLYFGGLLYLPRQLRQERKNNAKERDSFSLLEVADHGYGR